ncbi:DUF2000 domain-containing protein [Corynebacterium heidelbergense]|uniref:DUF2000 domain-containing protein n=1 Tax=Corynebacterium heidelbergense TaxID=2055947 RepID=A0A364V926_9CORY|nr:DUF2000 domain-containing protein [Corynebacterium heidelbergense]RAV33118.1 DUF2000 domain-containing protein [Corynebacterium heidelbergense]
MSSSANPSTAKIGVLLDEKLEQWQALNVTAFLVSGITHQHPELIGEEYTDATDDAYLPLLGQPVMVYAASPERLAQCHQRAVHRDLDMAIFSRGMFATNNDEDNRGVVRQRHGDDLDLVGLAICSSKSAVDKVFAVARLHP